jgi:pimeloyl-ACP methyl ester carboxylesterase
MLARERMLDGLPLGERVVQANGVATTVLEAGGGSPLVLLHGGIECGGPMWAPVVARLAAHHRLVIPDLPGLGESAPVDRLDVDTFATWFSALLDHTEAERPAVVAHSLTGSLAARAAAHGRLPASQLVVYAGPAVGPYRLPVGLRYAAVRFAIRPSERNAERFERFALLDRDATRRRDPDWYDAFSAYVRACAHRPYSKRTMRRIVAAETKPIADADLDRITIPTALLWGRHDRMAPLAIAEHAAARHGWPVHVVEDVAHAPHIERPHAFVDALGVVLATQTAPS